jgi:methylglutaconyl-CoA hydratase
MAAARKTQTAKPRRKRAVAASAGPEHLGVQLQDGVAVVALARPEVHNAFNETLIAELTATLRALDADPAVRVVVLAGQGRSFCAGADLTWMQRMAGYGDAENLADAGALAAMLATLDRMAKPTIARVHGAAYGGGVGLVACCDVAIAVQEATFSLSEARLGLIPATIGPYVVAAIGARQARRYFLTAERFTAAEAFRIGLVHDIVPADVLDQRLDALIDALLVAGPRAQAEAKALIQAVSARPVDDSLIADTVRRIATVRASAEGREGVSAFLQRRPPAWLPKDKD